MRLGFAELRIAAAAIPRARSLAYRQFVASGRHGTMHWLARDQERREAPCGLWPEAKTAIVLGMNYGPAHDPMAVLDDTDRAAISVYAQNRDYHDVMKGRLKELAGWLHRTTGEAVKVFVDTAPLLEKPLAERAGLGWQGKHTNLVSRRFGSWLFLGEILTTADLVRDAPEQDHCGNCRRCLDVCPTKAFPAPYQLDARRCISYLTIEHHGPIPRAYRKAIGNRVYGCDDCLAVCPWNKFAVAAKEAKLQARPELVAPQLAELLGLDDGGFRRLFAGSPVKRIGRSRFLRNVLIAAGNSGDATLCDLVAPLLADQAPVVRGAAVWAIRGLLKPDMVKRLREVHLPGEADPEVRDEWLN
jgi:epoxyqueuosine reductase